MFHVSTKPPSGESYELYASIFASESSPVELHQFSTFSALFTLLLVLIAFASLSMTLLGDVKKKSLVSYLSNSIIASISVALGSIYIANFVGVYI